MQENESDTHHKPKKKKKMKNEERNEESQWRQCGKKYVRDRAIRATRRRPESKGHTISATDGTLDSKDHKFWTKKHG